MVCASSPPSKNYARKWMRFFLVERTLYALRCTGPAERAPSDEPVVQKTLNSFVVAAK